MAISGNRHTVSVTFKVGSIETDPTVVTCTITNPHGVQLVYTYSLGTEIVRTATGKYSIDHTPVAVGRWTYIYQGTGAVEARQQGFIIVDPDGV
jgi:hypothetical protein